MRKLLEDAARRSIDYLESLPDRRVAPPPGAIHDLDALMRPLPDEGRPAESVLEELDRLGTPATVAMAGPRYFGFVIGGALPSALAANWLAAAWDQNSGIYRVTPAIAMMEQVSLEWMVDLLGLPIGTGGAFVTGATVANFTALAAARNRVLGEAGWDVEADGLFGAPPVEIIISDESHPSVYKALGMLGFGRARTTRVPIDAQGRMIAAHLPRRLTGPTIVCTQVGNVNTGACDPVAEICEGLDRSQPVWVHVDGAFGLWAAASPRYAHLTRGMELADSWATDAHKWLNVPYDSGIAFVRHPDSLEAAMAITAEYLPMADAPRNPSDFTPELSRRGRGIEVWAALSELGRDGVAALVERCCAHARRFADGLRDAGFEILNDVVLNQVLVSFGDDARTRRTIDAIQQDGTCWAGVTVWQGRTAMRISVSNWSTTEADVDRSLAAMIAAARLSAPGR